MASLLSVSLSDVLTLLQANHLFSSGLPCLHSHLLFLIEASEFHTLPSLTLRTPSSLISPPSVPVTFARLDSLHMSHTKASELCLLPSIQIGADLACVTIRLAKLHLCILQHFLNQPASVPLIPPPQLVSKSFDSSLQNTVYFSAVVDPTTNVTADHCSDKKADMEPQISSLQESTDVFYSMILPKNGLQFFLIQYMSMSSSIYVYCI